MQVVHIRRGDGNPLRPWRRKLVQLSYLCRKVLLYRFSRCWKQVARRLLACRAFAVCGVFVEDGAESLFVKAQAETVFAGELSDFSLAVFV